MALVGRILKVVLFAAFVALASVFGVRAIDSMRGGPLQPWHTDAPDDATAQQIETMDWAQWRAAENRVFQQVETEIVGKLSPDQQVPQNRYWSGSSVHAPSLGTDWNRSFTLAPEGPTVGSAVMLHGMTDAPYSLRHLARHYQQMGYHVVAIRLPGHGTVPAGLEQARAEDWQAATRLAVREASRRAPGLPLHIVGYSNGGALAVAHALDATTNASLGMPARLVLLSPMIGLTPFARFAGMAGWPAILPAFHKAAWLDIIPEYNPFKYNSFPVNAGAQAHRLTVLLTEKLNAAEQENRMSRMPPVLGFISVVDSTVNAPAVRSDLFDKLPANGSELILIDINRNAYVGPLIRPSALARLEQFLPIAPRAYRTTIIASGEPGAQTSTLRIFEPGSMTETRGTLPIPYPRDFYSLSHIALPFPLTDGLYGTRPDPADNHGVSLGTLALRGENGVLSVGMGTFNRVSANPFFPWFLDRLGSLPAPENAAGAPAGAPAASATAQP